MSRISVVIPTYNRASLIQRAIDSALGQTRRPDEVIVVDDRSTDDTVELLHSWQAKEPLIRAILQERNGGPAAARNRGVAESRGDLIAFLDSDDAWNPRHLEACEEYLDARPELDVVFADLRRLHENGRVVHPRYLCDHKDIRQYLVADSRSADWYAFRVPEVQALTHQYVVPIQTAVIRRDVAMAFSFDVAILGPEDYDFALRLARAGKRFGYINRVHCDCFLHEGNLLSNGRSAIRQSVEERKVWDKLMRDPDLPPPLRTVARDKLAQLYEDEGYGHRRGGDRLAALRAYASSLRMRWSWRGLKGLLATAVPRPLAESSITSQQGS